MIREGEAIDERHEGRLNRVLSAAVEAAGGGVGCPGNPPWSCYVARFLGGPTAVRVRPMVTAC